MVDKKRQDFEAWYKSEHPRILASMVVATGDLYLAQEVVDEAFVRAFDHWQRVRKMESPSGWTYRVAINLVRRWTLKLNRDFGKTMQSQEIYELPPSFSSIWQLVARLSKRQREVVVLRYIGDLTEVEIAKVLGITRGSVSQTLRAAHLHLEAAMEEDHQETEAGFNVSN